MSKKLNLVLFGPPGAGKGTQSEKIIEKYKLTHLSTGDLFRKHLGEGTDLGKQAQAYMDNGKLVPDEVVIEMVGEKLSNNNNASGYIFDGFPRTVAQAAALDKLLSSLNDSITLTIALEVDEAELRKRLLERGKTSGRADDQNEEKINTRIKVYMDETLPVADYFDNQKKFYPVEGVGTIDEIFNRICQTIDAKIK
ncbi:MAG TPA: adenylate kinase [Cyclobacteriaceae bacterium]|jgi:adenylate kinase